jgi:hypothetical protein
MSPQNTKSYKKLSYNSKANAEYLAKLKRGRKESDKGC